DRFVLTAMPQELLLQQVLAGLHTAKRGPAGRSGLLYIELAMPDQQFAAMFLDRLLANYLERAFDRSSLGKVSELEYLEKQTEDLKNQIHDLDEQIFEYRSQHNVVNLDIESELTLRQ